MLVFIAFPINTYSESSSNIRIEIDQVELESDVDPLIEEGRTLLPARALFEKLGGSVSWNASKREVTILYEGKTIVLTINNNIAIVNSQKVKMDVPAKIVNSRTVIPIRFVSENFGLFVEWDGAKRLVSVDTVNKGRLNSLDVTKGESSDVVNINVESYKSYSKSVEENPNALVLKFEGTKALESVRTGSKDVKNVNYLNNLKCIQEDYDTVKIVLETKDKQTFKIDETDKGINIEITSYSSKNLDDKGSLSYKKDVESGLISLNKIWLYEDSQNLYTVEKSKDGKRITLSFAKPLGNEIEDLKINPNDGLVNYITLTNYDSRKVIKIVIDSESKIKITDKSNGETENSKFLVEVDEEKEEEKNENDDEKSDEKVIKDSISVECNKKNGNSYVKIFGKDNSKYKAFRLTNPERIVIDIENAKVDNDYGELKVNNGMLSKIRYSQFESNKARIVLDLLKQYEYVVTFENGYIYIEVHGTTYKNIEYNNSNGRSLLIKDVKLIKGNNCNTTYDSKSKYFTLTFSDDLGSYGTGWLKIYDGKVDYLKVEEKEGENHISIKTSTDFTFKITPNNTNNSTTISLVENNNVEGLVVIDPGHGGSDPGAVSGGVQEKDLNLSVALKLNKLLKAKGVNTKLTRSTDVFIGLYERTDISNDLDADLFVSIHHNAYKESSNGTETLYNNDKGSYGVGFSGLSFAKIVQNKMVEKLGFYDRGVVNRPNLAVLKGSKAPAVLAEIGFITNPTERSKLITERYQNLAAEALCDSIIEALEKVN
jgi:N-acetylmuramoyl-L-alanine amidase